MIDAVIKVSALALAIGAACYFMPGQRPNPDSCLKIGGAIAIFGRCG
jgi:hypothetical protein